MYTTYLPYLHVSISDLFSLIIQDTDVIVWDTVNEAGIYR